MTSINFNSINEQFYYWILQISKEDMNRINQLREFSRCIETEFYWKNIDVAAKKCNTHSSDCIDYKKLNRIIGFKNGYQKYVENREASNDDFKTNYQKNNKMIEVEKEAAVIIYKLNILFEDNSLFIKNLLEKCTLFLGTSNINEIKDVLYNEDYQLVREQIVKNLTILYPDIDIELMNYKIDEILRFHINEFEIGHEKVIK